MKVKIKEFAIGMEVKSSGVGSEVRDTAGKFLGDCSVTMTGMKWCKGRTTQGRGQHTKWADFIAEQESK